jgi:NitT/TauT family transport system ATP-binding protein
MRKISTAGAVRDTATSAQETGPAPESACTREIDGRAPSGDHFIDAGGLTMRYSTRRASTLALDDVSVSVARKEFISLIGPSGCGKTTLLRILAGLIRPTEGVVQVAGKPLWQGSRRDDQALRMLGLVFQDAHLFPWYTVEDNIGLPLRLRGASKREWRAKAAELSELVQLGGFERSYPRELSGGMRQRVAIARALSYNPEILLMDEPFGALDAMTRDRMNHELQSIAAATGATVVFVTHSITEAVFLADRVVLLSARPGRLRSVTPVGFERPRDLEIQSDPGFQDAVRELRHQLYEDERKASDR